MSEIDKTILGFGLLCLTGGILIAYLGYSDSPSSLFELLFPFFLIFLGIAGVYAPVPQTRRVEVPPPPPTSVPPSMCCKFCSAEMQREYRFCKQCGKDVSK